MTLPPRRSRRPKLQFDALESRATPATLGAPWTDATHLSLSFVPDGTPIAGHTSTLFQALGARQATAAWQGEILRAFQTWASQANINIGLVPDGGQPLGTAGRPQHDPRFGDVRVGAQPMAADALSVSVPYDPAFSGTLAGDVLINADAPLAGPTDLLAVAMHEAGHVLGLDDNEDPSSVMFSHLNGNTTLSAGDVRAVQALYGTRSPDAFEGSSGDDTIARAAHLDAPGDYRGQTPLVAFGDIAAGGDVDVYALAPLGKYRGPVTIRLRSAGISLLAPKLTVLDEGGAVLAAAQPSGAGFGDDLTVHLPSVPDGTTLFLRAEGATSDVLGTGSYGLAVTYDDASTIDPRNLDAVLAGNRAGLDPNDLAELLLDPSGALLNNDQHRDDDLDSAQRPDTTPGYAQFTHYEAVGSISDASDVDFYRIRAAKPADGQPVVLTAMLRALDPDGAAPRVTLLDGDLGPVPSQVLANGDGTFTIQAAGLKDGANYYVRVAPGSSGTGGNYSLVVDFGRVPSAVQSFLSQTLAPGEPEQVFDFYVARSGLFQFLLSAGAGAPAGTSVEFAVVDQGGQGRAALSASPGDSSSADAVFLTPGQYAIRVRATGAAPLSAPLAYDLLGMVISDPIGPTLQDPTLRPIYVTPTLPGVFTYPTGTSTATPFLIAIQVPPTSGSPASPPPAPPPDAPAPPPDAPAGPLPAPTAPPTEPAPAGSSPAPSPSTSSSSNNSSAPVPAAAAAPAPGGTAAGHPPKRKAHHPAKKVAKPKHPKPPAKHPVHHPASRPAASPRRPAARR